MNKFFILLKKCSLDLLSFPRVKLEISKVHDGHEGKFSMIFTYKMQKLGYSSSKLSATVSILGILAVVLDKFGRELHYALYIVTRSNNSAQGSHFSSNVA